GWSKSTRDSTINPKASTKMRSARAGFLSSNPTTKMIWMRFSARMPTPKCLNRKMTESSLRAKKGRQCRPFLYLRVMDVNGVHGSRSVGHHAVRRDGALQSREKHRGTSKV